MFKNIVGTYVLFCSTFVVAQKALFDLIPDKLFLRDHVQNVSYTKLDSSKVQYCMPTKALDPEGADGFRNCEQDWEKITNTETEDAITGSKTVQLAFKRVSRLK